MQTGIHFERKVGFKYSAQKYVKLRQLLLPYNITLKELFVMLCDRLVSNDETLLKIVEQHNYKKHLELIKGLKPNKSEKAFSDIDENVLYDLINETEAEANEDNKEPSKED